MKLELSAMLNLGSWLEGLLDQWPTTPSGALSQKDKVIYDFSQINDAISEFYLLKEFVDGQS